jgi:uncharacterized protein (DUF1810 family)
MIDLSRFHAAQAGPSGHAQALAELKAGRKLSHWIWYIFPQLRSLGRSSTARLHGLEGLEEAQAWLADSLLGPRLLDCTRAATEATRRRVALLRLMGSEVDAMKLMSCMTLFSAAAGPKDAELRSLAEELLAAGEAQGWSRCAHTLAVLSERGPI